MEDTISGLCGLGSLAFSAWRHLASPKRGLGGKDRAEKQTSGQLFVGIR